MTDDHDYSTPDNWMRGLIFVAIGVVIIKAAKTLGFFLYIGVVGSIAGIIMTAFGGLYLYRYNKHRRQVQVVENVRIKEATEGTTTQQIIRAHQTAYDGPAEGLTHDPYPQPQGYQPGPPGQMEQSGNGQPSYGQPEQAPYGQPSYGQSGQPCGQPPPPSYADVTASGPGPPPPY